MTYTPQVGDVICYDFLWKEEQEQGRRNGLKDRPCAIVLMTKPLEDGSQRIMLAPITHSPPLSDESGIEIPAPVSRHLRLDDDCSWIKTHQVNVLTWKKDQIPFGVVPTKSGAWTYGRLPHGLGKKVLDEIRQLAQTRTLKQVGRDES